MQFPLIKLLCSLKSHNHLIVNKYSNILQSNCSGAFSHITWEPCFSHTCGFCRTIKANMVHPLKQKILHINDFVKSKKPYSWAIFDYYFHNEVFSKKSDSVNFLPFSHSNFMWNFRKILWAILEKSVYLMRYWQWFHRIPFCLKAEVQKSTLELQQFLRYISFKSLFGHV